MRAIFGRMEQLEPGSETRLAKVLHDAAERITRRGIVILISDMYDDPEEVLKSLQHLRFKGNDLIVFHVLDRNELEFEFSEPVLLEDIETEEQMHVLPDLLAEGYRATIGAHIERLRDGAAANRIDYELLTTDRPLDYALFSFLAKRARR
jgi:hypothetical protein